jgi:hypothetical protein
VPFASFPEHALKILKTPRKMRATRKTASNFLEIFTSVNSFSSKWNATFKNKCTVLRRELRGVAFIFSNSRLFGYVKIDIASLS